MQPLVTVLVPMHNSTKFIQPCLFSILNQTHQNLQVLALNDRSTDDTADKAMRFSFDPRFNLVKVKGGWIVPTLAEGSTLARGKYICVVDADDMLCLTAIEKCVAALEAAPEASFVYTNYVEWTPDTIKKGHRCDFEYSHGQLLRRFVTFHFRLIPTEKFREVGGFDVRLKFADDYDLCLRLAEVGPVLRIREYLYLYRIHGNNTSIVHKVEANQWGRFVRERGRYRCLDKGLGPVWMEGVETVSR